MVMATDVFYAEQQIGHEEPEVDSEIGEATALHEQLVRHVLAVSGELESRSGVWGEHSYARTHGHAINSQVRALLPEPEPDLEPDDVVDVLTEPRRPATPPFDDGDDELGDEADEADEADDDDADDDWEERLVALAPSAALGRLAHTAVGALRDLRLERLAGPRGRWARREGARAAARRLRAALAPHWAGGALWLHAALVACLPRSLAALYAELAAELRRALPRLADRLPLPRPAAPYVEPLSAVSERRPASEPGPWLAWAPGGCEAEDERWVRRLGASLHTRRLRTAPDAGPAPPDRWCAAVAHDARSALSELLTEAGRRAVILGGAGAGASLAAWLAAGAGAAARVRGLLLLAPPLLTAEGPRDCPDDVLEEVEVPLLAVVGGGAAQCWRGAAAEVASRFGAAERGASPARRVLLLAGADDALRLPRAHRRRLRLPQQALDAAVAEECARWAADVAAGRLRARRRPGEGEEARATIGTSRSVDVIEGRVVSRVSGGSPLALLPPRRVESRPERRDDALAVADIMQLPIVFADDDPAAARPLAADAPGALTVTSGAPQRDERARRRRGAGGGALRYARVLVAKRGRARAAPPAPAAARPAPPAARPAPPAARPAPPAARPAPPAARPAPPAARPVLLRRRAPPAPATDCPDAHSYN